MRRLDEAETQHKLALEYDSQNPFFHYNYGVFLEEADRLDQAEKEYRLASEIHINPDVNYDFVLISAKTSLLKDVEPIYKKSSGKDPINAVIHYRRGVNLDEME